MSMNQAQPSSRLTGTGYEQIRKDLETYNLIPESITDDQDLEAFANSLANSGRDMAEFE